jgi:N6-adenosine-specific RNA methylase IME4
LNAVSDYTDFNAVPNASYQVIYTDPPWFYYGAEDKMAAAGKHYSLMSDADLKAMPVRHKCADKAVVFMWATCPRLDAAVDLLREWGFHFRGVPFVWVKTRADGAPIGAQGVRPSIVKPLVELVVAGSTEAKGRPLPLLDEAVQQTVFSPRGRHSEKPVEVRNRIDRLYGPVKRLEMFARGAPVAGWDRFGNQLGGEEPTVLDLL